MPEVVHGTGSDVVLFVLLGILSGMFTLLWFSVRRYITANDIHHRESMKAIEDIRLSILSKEEILQLCNGTYLTRRDFDQNLDQRSEWRTLLMERLDKMEKAIDERARRDLFDKTDLVVERLRTWQNHEYKNDVAPVPLLNALFRLLERRVEKLEKLEALSP